MERRRLTSQRARLADSVGIKTMGEIVVEQMLLDDQTVEAGQPVRERVRLDGQITRDPKDPFVPKAYRGFYRRAMKGKSRAAAIRAFCLECVGWQGNEVRHCTATECFLYPWRMKGGY